MSTDRGPAKDLLEVARALLLVQGAILVATAIEALIWGVVFAGAGGTPLFSAGSAVALLIARVRLRTDRKWPRRLIYVVEAVTLAFVAVDIALAIALTHALPPLVAVVTQLVLPLSVITLLHRSTRAVAAPIASRHVSALEVTS